MDRFVKLLADLKARGRYRSLKSAKGLDLTSNDYLGMREHPGLRAAALAAIEGGMDLGAGGSRLLRGNAPEHEALEEFAASYFACEKALYFPTGFQANTAIFQALPGRHDTILFDEYIHASAREGIQNSPAAQVKLPHNDLNAYEVALKKVHEVRRAGGMLWLAVESLYSMDGDIAPLAEIAALAQKYEAMLIVDEAHATGVLGENGKGLSFGLEQDNIITLHTCGKAVGVAGGLVCASAEIIDTLINTARAFIYSTAPMPLQAHLVRRSLEILTSEDGDARRYSLSTILHYVKLNIGGTGVDVLGWAEAEPTHIVPIILGEDAHAVEVAAALQVEGYDIRAIRPPTVPEGTARLRLSLSSQLQEDTLQVFFEILSDTLRKRRAA